ncbi:RagB/SusD family nutrient uptake outer membrane protein [Hymenobacter crusticola]|uniref:RagB/SusD family nutrient uptake outer membrane protein n=1 Tax=Hymenobacter crusticola TaxID=1770526 RepID=A0A243WET6_9BACT|nr:RagB/SusD family nutrient uptake outer membrane protein [Hymenobacter crusticola]OUJ74223.1 RagB/SusD family nutrient uptake outer membrane protein [Hymenobacter crusticola]
MKKIVFLLSSVCWLSLSGCEKDLDQTPLSSGSTPTFYQTQADFDQALSAAYAPLVAYPTRALNLSETRSDNIYGVDDLGVRDWAPVNNFSTALVNNPYVAEAWSGNYNGIFRVNTLLDQLANNGGVVADAARTRYEGEAKFLRAFYYFDLVRFFGKVPLIDKALVPAEVAKVPRTPVADVYNLIISDLQTAIANLPASYDGSVTADKPNVGRATSNAAKSLLALVYLTRSGPTYGIEGPGLATNEYTKALPLLNEVLNSGKYSFLASYPDIFSYTNENNKEVIFDIQFLSGGAGLGSDFPGLLVPDAYFTALKIPFASGGLEIRPIANDLLNSYPAGDVRKTFNFAQGYTSTTGFKETRWLMKKYLNESARGTTRTDWGINWIVLRYTDVLLMKAECILHGAGGSQAEVDDAVNRVRTRAGVTTKLTGVTLPQLMEERRRELAGEGSRWHDLVREGLVLTTINAWIPKEDTRNRMSRNVDANQIIYPVPQAERSAAPGLYDQNLGYQ